MAQNLPSQVDMLEERFREIRRLFSQGAIAQARQVLERLEGEFSPESIDNLRYVRARIYEEGLFDRVEIDAAIVDFTALTNSSEYFVVAGLEGRARMLYKKDSVLYCDEVIALCTKAVSLESSPMAMLLLAAVYEETKLNFGLAKKWALRAFRNRSPWGLSYYTMMLYRRRNYITGVLCELAAFATKPFMLARYKVRGPFV
jgi:hypothetical protein